MNRQRARLVIDFDHELPDELSTDDAVDVLSQAGRQRREWKRQGDWLRKTLRPTSVQRASFTRCPAMVPAPAPPLFTEPYNESPSSAAVCDRMIAMGARIEDER